MAELTDFRGVFFIKIRKDGTILLPREWNWNPGDMLELKGYGFTGRVIVSHLINESFFRKKIAELESKQTEGGQADDLNPPFSTSGLMKPGDE